MSDDFEYNVVRGRGGDKVRGNRRRRNNSGAGYSKRNDQQSEQRSYSQYGWTRPNAEKEKQQQRRRDKGIPRHQETDRALPFSDAPAGEASLKIPFDPWRLLEAVKRRWLWLVCGTALLGLITVVLATMFTRYSVSISLIRRETSNAFRSGEVAESFMPRELSEQTLMSLMRAPEVMRRVAEKAKPKLKPDELGKRTKVSPTPNPDIVVLSVFGKTHLTNMVDLLNLYAEEVIKYTKEMQAQESGQVNDFLKQKLEFTDGEIERVKRELLGFSQRAGFVNFEKETEAYLAQLATLDTEIERAKIEAETLDLRIKGAKENVDRENPANEKLLAAQDQLNTLLTKYTDQHPDVIAQRGTIEALKKQALAGPPPGTKAGALAAPFTAQIRQWEIDRQAALQKVDKYAALKATQKETSQQLSEKALQYAVIKGRLNSLQISRDLLAGRQRETQLFVSNAMGYYRPISVATIKDVQKKKRWIKVGVASVVGAGLGFLAALSLILLAEAMDNRLKTAGDIERITGLPVLATLGDLKKMGPEAQIQWAFKTLTLLRGKLNRTPNEGLVCGFISSGHGEGRSTWINLLVSAASQRGLKVMTVDTRPTTANPAFSAHDNGGTTEAENQTLTSNVLARAADVADQLSDSSNQPVVHIPLPGWVWNLERRHQWQEAMEHWRKIENLVLLVELPPASKPEAVLLAENLPQLIWLTGSGMAEAKETNEQIEILRHARCNIVGAVLNNEPSTFLRQHLGRWVSRAAAVITLAMGLTMSAQEPVQTSASTNVMFSALTRPPKKALWQQRLTLGPGDALDIALYGYPDLTKTNLFVGPDGRLSFLQVQNLPVVGMTIDELRAKLDQELEKYYRAPRTIVSPVAFTSKKYYMLGKVATKGVFTLDRPVTVIEAVARARGLETGLYERTTVELADLGRSFLVRGGKRVPVNFEKLFFEGDLSQNVLLEPNDYLYFAGSGVNEIYVLGEVLNPGPLGFVPNATIVTALADRGGFTSRAYKGRILVIRGSLNQPETYAIDSKAIFSAQTPDFKLQPKDIVYVSPRPWIKVEELLDAGLQAFIEGAVTTWTGANIGPIVGEPVLPQL